MLVYENIFYSSSIAKECIFPLFCAICAIFDAQKPEI